MYSGIAENKRKTFYLIVLFITIIGALGWLIGAVQGSYSLTVGVAIGAVIYAFIMYFASDKIALSISGAKPITRKDNTRLWNMVENLSITAGLPMPKVYVIDDPAPNAFATGRDPEHASVAATTGLLNMLDDTELEGVMAHELSHVGNYDIRVSMMVLALVAIVSLVSDFFLRTMWFGGGRRSREGGSPILVIIGIAAAVLAPLIASLVRMAVSRQREYLADASGALLTRYPEGLASALQKIGSYKQPMRHASTATAHLFFENPLKKSDEKEGGIAHLFSTHPPIQARVKRLMELGRGQ